MTKELEALERRIERLRAEVRRAAAGGDRDRATGLRAELREGERQWDESVERLETEAHEYAQTRVAPARAEALVPAREQVHQALTLLGAPAASRLIVADSRAIP